MGALSNRPMTDDEIATIRRYVAEHSEQSILGSLLQNLDAVRSGALVDTDRLDNAIADLRQQHQEKTWYGINLGEFVPRQGCKTCLGSPWPCSVAILLEYVAATRDQDAERGD